VCSGRDRDWRNRDESNHLDGACSAGRVCRLVDGQTCNSHRALVMFDLQTGERGVVDESYAVNDLVI
jgi:hypothetical protein